jgi:hypothetical protein
MAGFQPARWITLRISSASKARIVVDRRFPWAAIPRSAAAAVSSSGPSTTVTRS